MNWTICFFIVLLMIFFYIVSKYDTEEDISYRNYHITKRKKKNNADDAYNIKEYDVMNENIVIHNKFKNELVDYRNTKYEKEHTEYQNKSEEQQRLKDEIDANAKKLMFEEIKKTDARIRRETESIKNSIKKEINDFLIDYNAKRATTNDIIIILKNIDNEITNTLKYMNNMENDSIYLKAPEEKINILEKKKRLFTKLMNL